MPGARPAPLVLFSGLAAAFLPLLIYRRYLSSQALIYAWDNGQYQYLRYEILTRALQHDHAFPLWQTLIQAGSPFHANPETPSLYPPTLLLAAWAPAVLVMNLTILLHLSGAALGMQLFVVRLARRMGFTAGQAAAGGLVGGLAFALNLFMRLEHFNFLSYGPAHALIPWILLAGDSLLHGERPRRAAAVLALLLAGQVATGGLYVYAYTAFGLALWWALTGLCGTAATRRRALLWMPAALLLAGLMVCAKLWGFPAWVATTNRAGQLPIEVARGVTLGGFGDFSWGEVWSQTLRATGFGLTLALALPALALLRRSEVRAAFVVTVVAVLLALGGDAHEFLYEHVPPFDRIRNARRAWTLANAFLPLLAGLGVAWLGAQLAAVLATRLANARRRGLLLVAAGMLLPLGTLPLLLQSWRHERALEQPERLSDLVRRYPNWNQVAAAAGERWRATQLDVTSPAARNEQFIAAANWTEIISGQFGNAWPRMTTRLVYGDERPMAETAKLRRIGILSTRFAVTADTFGLPDESYLPGDPRTFPIGVDGERIVANPYARPRAMAPSRVVGLFGDQNDALLYALIDLPDFRTERWTLLCFDEDHPPSDEELERLDAVVVASGASLPPAAETRLRARPGLRRVEVELPPNAGGLATLTALAGALPPPDDPLVTLPFERRGAGCAVVDASDVARESAALVVVSETWSLYPGWEAEAIAADGSRRPLPLRRADGVATALLLHPGETTIEARYAPADVRTGFWIGACGLLATLGLLLWPARGAASES